MDKDSLCTTVSVVPMTTPMPAKSNTTAAPTPAKLKKNLETERLEIERQEKERQERERLEKRTTRERKT